MEYRIFRFTFGAGVHIGEGSLEDRGIRLRADTVFSSLCVEAVKAGGGTLDRLVSFAQNGTLRLSDAFPFIGDEAYVPKPAVSVRAEQDRRDSGVKKIFKKLRYIPLDMAQDFLSGEFDTETAEYVSKKLNHLGGASVMTRAAVRGPEDTLPYHVGVFTFQKDSGLYIIAGGEQDALSLLRDLLDNVARAGVGGKRSSGLGRFSAEEKPVPEDILVRLDGEYPAYMTLSVSLPREPELERSLENATYALVRRGGFVFSETYSGEPLRKNDLYVLDSGSVVRHRYQGGVYDVSNQGAHPVYRYAKPLFFGVTL